MKISSQSVAALAELTTAQCVQRCVCNVRESFPQQARDVTDDDLHRQVSAIVDRLRSLGFEYTGDIEQAAPLMYAVRYGANRMEIPPELRARLGDRQVPVEKKIEALEQLLMFGTS